MKAILTVIGRDQVGIIAAVCTLLSEKNVNVMDISQTIMQGYFTMMMATDVSASTVPMAQLAAELDRLGKEMGLSIRIQRRDLFTAMHRI